MAEPDLGLLTSPPCHLLNATKSSPRSSSGIAGVPKTNDYLRVLRQIHRDDGEGKEVPEADPPVKTLSLHDRDVADDRCHAVQDRLHRAEGFRRFAFREADPRSIPFRAVRIRRITGIR